MTTSRRSLPSNDVPGFVAWLRKRPQPPSMGAARTDAATRPTKGERTRSNLLVAAAGLLEERGYDNLNTADVCECAGITRTALYKHFPHKQALVLALLEDFQSFMGEALRPVRTAGGSREDAVLATNLSYVRFFRANARVIHAVQQARRALDDAERLQFEMNESWARKIALAIEAASGQRATAKTASASREALATAYALEAMVDGFLGELFLRRNPHLLALKLSDEQVARVLSAAWLGAVDRNP